MSGAQSSGRRGRSGETSGKGKPSSSDTGRTTGHDVLADRLGDLARSLALEGDVEATLDAIVHSAVGTVPGAENASISAVQRRRHVITRASTDELPRAVDHVQYDSGQGPCLDALYEQRTVRLSDMSRETRWPEFTERASELGVGSMLAVQLFLDGDDLGALNLFSGEPDAFSDESEHVALLFAAHAAVALFGMQKQDQLSTALGHRDVIGQAKGILMERYKIDGDVAFRVLTRASQQANRKLHVVAQDLVSSGRLPEA